VIGVTVMPKVIFTYSWIYDQHWKDIQKKKSYHSPKKIENFIRKAEKLWRKDEKKILAELSRITGLKWKSKAITCYVVGRCAPFSDPLTLPVMEKYPDYFIDTLIHELLHQLLFVQNEAETKKAWDYIFKKYRKEPLNTKLHIPVHAVHSHIYLKFFDERRLKREIKVIRFMPDYKRSWEIVERSHKEILREFKSRIKKLNRAKQM